MPEFSTKRVVDTLQKTQKMRPRSTKFSLKREMSFDSSFCAGIALIPLLQGDTSGCAKPPVDIDLKVAF